MSQCPLYERFPGLEERLPRLDLCRGPSPVRRLEALEKHLGRSDLWMKNDGLLGATYGGNKVRKLEWILADAERRHASTILTFGGTGSHHCLATAVFARELGIRVAALLLEQPETDEVRQVLSLLDAFGARTARARNLPTAAVKAAALALSLTQPGLPPRPPYLLWVGASVPLGCVGYVNAALELAQQVREGQLPQPRTIVLPLGSNGTSAGLLLGLRLAGLDAPLLAVKVTDMPTVGERWVMRLARGTARLLRRHGADLPPVSVRPRDLTIISDAETQRYGHPTEAGEEAKRLMAELEGLTLDSTYTAKTVAKLIQRSDLPRPVLYWHTLNAHPLPTP